VKEPATESPSPRPSDPQAKDEETIPESSTTKVGGSPYGQRPDRLGPRPGTRLANGELARLKGDEAARERELREAHRLLIEMGALIRAEQVAKELAS
jgi:hypothetical protein